MKAERRTILEGGTDNLIRPIRYATDVGDLTQRSRSGFFVILMMKKVTRNPTPDLGVVSERWLWELRRES